jgi:hypothetical protein
MSWSDWFKKRQKEPKMWVCQRCGVSRPWKDSDDPVYLRRGRVFTDNMCHECNIKERDSYPPPGSQSNVQYRNTQLFCVVVSPTLIKSLQELSERYHKKAEEIQGELNIDIEQRKCRSSRVLLLSDNQAQFYKKQVTQMMKDVALLQEAIEILKKGVQK